MTKLRFVHIGAGMMLLLAVAYSLAGGLTGHAAEFRAIKKIKTPTSIVGQLPPGAQTVRKPTPVSRRKVKKGVKDIARAWNRGALSGKLGRNLYDKSRLVDNIARNVPRDARLRITGVSSIATLNQHLRAHPSDSNALQLVSTVTATANLQIEFNDASGAFQRREGVSELTLEVVEKVRP